MKNRVVWLLLLLLLVFGIYAVTRYALNLPADQRGYDAIDYVILHGNVQHETPASPVRPTDVTGVYIYEGHVNQTMIELLRYLPNLRSITVGPDFSGVAAGTPASQLPKPSAAATTDVKKMQEAFPDLKVQIATLSRGP
ncbi:secreted protein [Rhodopirellula maiorica SM1]|uniref:Secreted protein n=1 Tax=Rhodopirellula maiorica SM1 TaxID=1265738 RepID=M5RNW6_9BACT|nr:hypothetical protein [Rhodopirellula maiorica]EMI21023.1 secreted protein [Rhodopirellula maiorica SM1]